MKRKTRAKKRARERELWTLAANVSLGRYVIETNKYNIGKPIKFNQWENS